MASTPAPSAPPAGGLEIPRTSPAAEEAARQHEEAVQKALNPEGLPPYSGPVGAVRGVVKVSGDPAPLMADMVAKLPAEGCPRAQEMERKLFRQGVAQTLADVLVTVTGYPGFLKPKTEAVRVEASGCAFDGKLIALVYGQRLEVFNRDANAYMPRLVGVPTYALRVAMPGGGPVPIIPPKAGRYVLIDETREYMRSEVYVLNYPTFDVTGLDGEFEITGIPTGSVRITAFSPALGKVSEQRVEIQAGVTTKLDFELQFSQAQYEAALREKPAAAPATAPAAAGQPSAAP
ncbi:MAG TPA: carboxypeptidase-like regulatory domain-containing protein [Polyangiaceae bacterium]|nr:carboxypeptidase-like regulatory domain-containing protein [Polyangiaceae bacterium]